MYYLTYDESMYDDTSYCEEFETVEELLERYKEIQYEYTEFVAWKEDEKIYPFK